MSYAQLKAELRHVAFTTATPFTRADPDYTRADSDTSDGESTQQAGEVDHDALSENLIAIAEKGARLFIPCGNTGEYYALTDEERSAVVETHVEAVGDGGTVVGGVGGSTRTAIELLERYETAGADAAMIMHPVHTYVHEEGLIEYYRRLADSTDLGIVLYKRGPEVTRRVLQEVTTIENVVAVKYAVNDVKDFSQSVTDVSGDVVWLNGIAERYALSFAVEGAEGFTTGIGNFVPEETIALFDAIEAGELDRARTIRDLLRPYEDLREEAGVENVLSAANNVPAVKYGMELAGLYGGPVREPLSDLSSEDRSRAEAYYDRIAARDVSA